MMLKYLPLVTYLLMTFSFMVFATEEESELVADRGRHGGGHDFERPTLYDRRQDRLLENEAVFGTPYPGCCPQPEECQEPPQQPCNPSPYPYN